MVALSAAPRSAFFTLRTTPMIVLGLPLIDFLADWSSFGKNCFASVSSMTETDSAPLISLV